MGKRVISLMSVALLMLSVVGCGTGEIDIVDVSESANADDPATIGEPASEDTAYPAIRTDMPEPDQEIIEPELDNNWEIDTPQNHGMDPEMLAQLHSAVADVEIHSILTVKDGMIIDEYYKEGYDENTVFTLQSCSKSFTGALIGLAIEQGYISGVDSLLSDYLPQLDAHSEDTRKQQITIEHLLTHTSGLEWYEWGGNSSSWRPFQEADNWVDYILSRNMIAQPGTYFAYTTGGSHLLAAVLQEATGKSVLEYGKEYIFDPMGMDSVEWRTDAQGIIDGGNGIAMTARDAAKFGQLFLEEGQWRGSQILPASWVETSVERKITGADNAAAYGYQWWVRSCGAANYETYYAMGAGGQFIFVVPELNLVTVMTSRSRETYAPRTYFIDYILAAYTQA